MAGESREFKRVFNHNERDRSIRHQILNIGNLERSQGCNNYNIVERNIADVSNVSSYWSGLYNILILASCILFSSAILLLPQHDSIIYQEYWYESIIVGALSFCLTNTLDTLVACKFYFNIPSMVSFGVFIRLYVATASVWVVTCLVSYSVWTLSLGYNHPMPLSAMILGCVPYIGQFITLYFQFPREFAIRNDVQKRIRAFNISRIWAIIVDLQFKGLTILFTLVPTKLQWILAFLLPIMRESNLQILNYIMIKSANVRDGSGKIAIIIGVNTFHALYVAIKLGNTATEVTSYCILTVDFVLNLRSCYKFIQLHKSIAPEGTQVAKEKESLLVGLILIENLEVLVPLAYILTVIIAYYGPNGEILGNIRNNLWQYQSIDRIERLVLAVLWMCIIDLFSAIIVGCSLWKMCSVNLLHEACKVLDNYWIIIACNLSNYLNYVSLKCRPFQFYIDTAITY